MRKRPLHKLTPREVAAWKGGPSPLSDGGGLYVFADAGGARKRWIFRFQRRGGQRDMGLGSAAQPGGVTLAKAREEAAKWRSVLEAGRDPIEERKADAEREAARQAAEAAKNAMPTFGEFADRYIANKRAEWHNDKHVRQWETTLRDHAAAIRSQRIDEVDKDAVLSVLRPIWERIPETAQRLRGRIEAVLDAAKADGLRTGENPARWRGHLKHLLAKRRRLTRGHHRALPVRQVPDFMQALRAEKDRTAKLLEFVILTCARSNEARGARFAELDLLKKVWTVPPERMKAKEEHRVPLCDRAVEIVREAQRTKVGHCQFVFPGRKGGKFSDMAMAELLKRMGFHEATTAHGFRSAFRDWAGEETSFPADICEAALAHRFKDKTRASYQRGDLLEKRRKLMIAWERYCTEGGKVVRLKTRVAS